MLVWAAIANVSQATALRQQDGKAERVHALMVPSMLTQSCIVRRILPDISNREMANLLTSYVARLTTSPHVHSRC